MKEYDLVKQIAVLLTNKKGKSPICSFTAPDETTHDEEWAEKEGEGGWNVETFPQCGGDFM